MYKGRRAKKIEGTDCHPDVFEYKGARRYGRNVSIWIVNLKQSVK